MTGAVIGGVLDPGQHQRGSRGKETAEDAVALAADGVVVEAVGRNGDGDVVGEEQQHIGQVAQDRRLKGLDGQRPEAEVGKEEVILDEHDGIADGDDDQRQQRAQTQLLQRHFHAALGQIQAVFPAVGEIVDDHAEDGEQAAAGGPEAQAHGLALGDRHGVADLEQS